LSPAFPFTAVYLRPTLTDGDAVSIREALDAGVPVVASNVVRRPRGVVTAELDVPAWRAAIVTALERGASHCGSDSGTDAASELIDIYAGLGCAVAATAEPVTS